MTDFATVSPVCRSELIVRPIGQRGDQVIHVPRTGEYLKLSAEGHFLLSRLDGKESPAAIRSAFAESFGEPLSQEDWEAFLHLAESRGLLEGANREASAHSDVKRLQT